MESVRGRFAPTPSGPLHFGSLVAALASALDARSRAGEWLLRIDDLDQAREVAGARDAILQDLATYGFVRDGAVRSQRGRSEHYRQAVKTLLDQGHAFPCACSRGDVEEQSDDGLYPGTCRNGLPAGKTARSIRLRVPAEVIEFEDLCTGINKQNLAGEVGDFVLWRADGIASYHLATVLDDAHDSISHVVRGADLLDSTPRQIYLQRLLGLPTPVYTHFPLVLEHGRKLGKQTDAPCLDRRHPGRTLTAALEFLNQSPPRTLQSAHTNEVWQWAIAHWQSQALRRTP